MKLFISLVALTLSFQTLASTNFVEHLQCQIDEVIEPNSNPSATLDVFVDLKDGMSSTFNGVHPQKTVDAKIAKVLGMAQVVELNDMQYSITLDFQNVYIKDVASYACSSAP